MIRAPRASTLSSSCLGDTSVFVAESARDVARVWRSCDYCRSLGLQRYLIYSKLSDDIPFAAVRRVIVAGRNDMISSIRT